MQTKGSDKMPSPAKATNLAKRRLQKVLTKSKKRKRNWAEPCESDILQNAVKATKTRANLLQYLCSVLKNIKFTFTRTFT